MKNEQIDIMIELIEDYKDVLEFNCRPSISDSEEELLNYLKRRQTLNIDSVDCQLCADCESNEVYKNGLCFECQDRHPEI